MLKVWFQIASCTKISKLNIMVKVVKLFTGVYEKATLNVIGKHLCRSLFFKKVSCQQAKERLLHRYFSMSFTKYFRTLFFVKQLWVAASAKYPFFFVTSTSVTKNVSFNLGYFKHFRDIFFKNSSQVIHSVCCEMLANSSLWKS